MKSINTEEIIIYVSIVGIQAIAGKTVRSSPVNMTVYLHPTDMWLPPIHQAALRAKARAGAPQRAKEEAREAKVLP